MFHWDLRQLARPGGLSAPRRSLRKKLNGRPGHSQVKAHMAPPESLAEAVVRVRRQVSGGGIEDDEDDDDGILVSHQVVSLKDPMSGLLMKVRVCVRLLQAGFPAGAL